MTVTASVTVFVAGIQISPVAVEMCAAHTQKLRKHCPDGVVVAVPVGW